MKRLIPILTIWFSYATHLAILYTQGCLHTWQQARWLPHHYRWTHRSWANEVSQKPHPVSSQGVILGWLCGDQHIRQCFTDSSYFLISVTNVLEDRNGKNRYQCCSDYFKSMIWSYTAMISGAFRASGYGALLVINKLYMMAHNAVFALMYSACYLCTAVNIWRNKSIPKSSSISIPCIKYVSKKCAVIYLISIVIVMLFQIQATNKDNSEKHKGGETV